MIARLQVFYGGSPMDWFRTPLCVLRAFIAAMPRLRAERSLERVGETLIGTGNMEKRYAERTLSAWEREASGPTDWQGSPLVRSEQERRELYKETGFFEVEVVDEAVS